MRYEVLRLLCEASGGLPDVEQNVSRFAFQLGTWQAEVFRVTEWLDRAGLIRYCGAGPTVCLTQRGVDFLKREGRRKSVRPEDV